MFPEDEDNDDENFSKPTFEYDPEIDDGEGITHYLLLIQLFYTENLNS